MKKLLILLALLSIFVLSACSPNNDLQTNNSNEQNYENTENNENINEIKKIDQEKDLVFYQFESKDVKIPFINLDYDNIKEINNHFKDMVNIIHSDVNPAITHYDSKFHLNNNILSVVGFLKSEYGVAANRYDIYNIDIFTGKLLSNKELVSAIGKNDNDIFSSLEDAYINEFIIQNDLQNDLKINFNLSIDMNDLYKNLKEDGIICSEDYYNSNSNSSIPYENGIGFRNEVFRNTLSRIDNIGNIENVQMYLSDENKLKIVTSVGGFAGAT